MVLTTKREIVLQVKLALERMGFHIKQVDVESIGDDGKWRISDCIASGVSRDTIERVANKVETELQPLYKL